MIRTFLYAYLRPGRELSEREKKVKMLAIEIIRGIEEGKEHVVTTVVHFI